MQLSSVVGIYAGWRVQILGPWKTEAKIPRSGHAGRIAVDCGGWRDAAWLVTHNAECAARGVPYNIVPVVPGWLAYAWSTRSVAGGAVVVYNDRAADETLLRLPSKEVAAVDALYTHSHPVHPALHLAWMMGAEIVDIYGIRPTKQMHTRAKRVPVPHHMDVPYNDERTVGVLTHMAEALGVSVCFEGDELYHAGESKKDETL